MVKLVLLLHGFVVNRRHNMKPFARDITITITVKLLLLFLLWWICVRGMHPVLTSTQEWMLGKKVQSVTSYKTQEVIP